MGLNEQAIYDLTKLAERFVKTQEDRNKIAAIVERNKYLHNDAPLINSILTEIIGKKE